MATWQFANDHNGFNNFDAASTGALEQCYTSNNGKGVVKLFLNGWPYEYDFDNMTQNNTKTNKVRKITRIAPATPAAAGAAGKRVRPKNDDASDDDDEGNKKSHKAEGGKKSGNDKSAANKSGGTAASLGKVVIKGRGAVDSFSGKQDSCHVIENGNVVYQCTLNQTNISNNNNKFYIGQALASDDGKQFFAWFRWGRIGETGQSSLAAAATEAAAITLFTKKFSDKTGNSWANCGADYSKFVKKDGLYQLMAIDLGNSTSDKLNQAAAALENVAGNANQPTEEASKLPVAVQNLMKIISNKEEMTRALKELEIDTKKMPLGMISKDQIKTANAHLKKIEAELAKAQPSNDLLSKETSAFYTLIPHDWGRRTPPVIKTAEMLQQKIDLMDVLSGLEVAAKLLDAGANNNNNGAGAAAKTIPNRLDRAYSTLNNQIVPLDHNSEEFKRLEEYLHNSHAPTHNMYKLKVIDIFTVDRAGEAERYKPFHTLHNRQLLWHGSRLTNWMGILSQGLRIAPPEAPVTGYMFGKAAYHTNTSSKSANYCFTTSEQTTGFMLLNETALGNQKEYKKADSNASVDMKKFHSVIGLGRSAPDPKGNYVDADGVIIPMGKVVPTGVNDTVLLYPEMMVYDVAQAKMRYLFRLEFIYAKKCGTFH